MKQFEVLFKELDKNLAQLNIATYGLSDTTLEEVGQPKYCGAYIYVSEDIEYLSIRDTRHDKLTFCHNFSLDFPESCEQ